MFTYYLCNDNDTIHRIKFSLKEEEKSYYLSLLENYLTELVFVEEGECKKLVKKNKIEKENKDSISIEEGMIFLEKKEVIATEKIEDYLPLVVTIKTKKYYFLRPWTIFWLIKLLYREIAIIDNPYIKQIERQLGYSDYIDFNLLCTVFFDESGNPFGEKSLDYNSLISLLRGTEVRTTETYSRCSLAAFWQGDDAERELAAGIASDAPANRRALEKLNLELKRLK